MNEQPQPPVVERFIETLTALIMQYEQDIEPDQERSPIGVLRYLMEERNMRQLDLVPLIGGKSYVSQIFSGHRPISKDSAAKLHAQAVRTAEKEATLRADANRPFRKLKVHLGDAL